MIPLEEFSCQSFSLKEVHIQEHVVTKDLAESGSGDPIFVVFDKKKNPVGVIKTVSDQGTFQTEYQTLLNPLPLKEFHTVPLKGIREEEGLYWMAEGFAPGVSLNQYLKKLSRARGENRDLLFSELGHGIEKTALALHELHNYNSLHLIHGDAHPGNIFYDTATDRVTFIDLADSRQNAPALEDVANFLLTLEILATYYHLSPSEINHLTNTFLNTYPTNPEELKSYKQKIAHAFANMDAGHDVQARFIHSYCKQLDNSDTLFS